MILATDIDSTLILNTAPKNLDGYICPSETPRGKSYIHKNSLQKLQEISKKIDIVPVTTRGIISYETIDLKIKFKYALVDNGAILLVDGKVDEEWINESRKLVEEDHDLFELTYSFLESHGFKTKTDSEFTLDFNIPSIDINERNRIYEELKLLIGHKYDVFTAGERGIYATHKRLSKGLMLERFLKKIDDVAIAAGDSGSDWSMMIGRESIGLSDSPATYKYPIEKFNEDKFKFIEWVVDKMYELTI